jgi:hypothetical protein
MFGRLIDPLSRYAAELQMRTIDSVFRKWEPSLRWQNGLWKLSIPGRKSPSGELEIFWGLDGESLIAFIERVEREWMDFCADYTEPVGE